MFKHLFFDDRFLFEREGLKREYGTPELIEDAIYKDPNASTVWSSPWVFKLDNGKYRMLYYGKTNIDTNRHCMLSAISDDGIHFEPEDLSDYPADFNRMYKNEVMEMNGEIACMFEDRLASPDQRYKLFYTSINFDTFKVEGTLYISHDLLSWRLAEGVRWSEDGEPLLGIFYNHKRECYTLLKRPTWGTRMLGYIETKDFKTFTPYVHCLQQDSLDSPLDEIYGMPTFPYEGWFIGLPHIYSGFGSFIGAKYSSGTMHAQLAYSHNGTNWFRSLRDSFISECKSDEKAQTDDDYPMVWPTSVRYEGEDIYIYASASLLEHGPAFRAEGLMGRIFVYRLRKDGFIKLTQETDNEPMVVATRENVWHKGELHINLKSKGATLGVWQSDKVENVGMNNLGICEACEGFSHEDCIPFSGDSTDWVPQFKNGRCLDELKGKVLVFEIRLSDGEIYSISGDMTPVFNVEAEQYRRFKELPYYL